MKITDLHMHVVPGVDDGSLNLSMSLDMLMLAYEQGARRIFCTSHNGYSEYETAKYKSQFMMLQLLAGSQFPDLELYTGCEILCAGEYIEDILYGLDTGIFLPLGSSKCVLTELYPDATPDEAIKVVESLILAGWKPILAHTERYASLFDGKTVKRLIDLGALIQINLYSLDEETNDEIKERARYLIHNRLAHFVGSDAHRLNYRTPKYEFGIAYLKEQCSKDYVNELCFKNADKWIFGRS